MIPSSKIAIIIPALNAASTLPELFRRIRSILGQVLIVVVDDGSTDNTSDVAKDNGAVILRHEQNLGKGAALRSGFRYILTLPEIEFILTMDADLQHRPEDIPQLLEHREKTFSYIVIGNRKRYGVCMPFHRILSNTITSTLVSWKTHQLVKDSQCGFRLIHRNVIANIECTTNGYEAETEFLIRASRKGYRFSFAPIETVYGNERSYMTHLQTTINFLKVLLRKYS